MNISQVSLFRSEDAFTALPLSVCFWFWAILHSAKTNKQTSPSTIAAALKGSAKWQPLTTPAMTTVLVRADKTTSASKFSHDCHIRGKQSRRQSCQRHRITHFRTDAALKCLSATLLRAVCSQLPNVMKTSCLLVQTAQSKRSALTARVSSVNWFFTNRDHLTRNQLSSSSSSSSAVFIFPPCGCCPPPWLFESGSCDVEKLCSWWSYCTHLPHLISVYRAFSGAAVTL